MSLNAHSAGHSRMAMERLNEPKGEAQPPGPCPVRGSPGLPAPIPRAHLPDQIPAGSVGGWWYRGTPERPRRRMKAMSEPLHRTLRVGHRVPAFIAVPVVVIALGSVSYTHL